MISIEAFIAANRFGLGPHPGELQLIELNPREWLHDQVSKDLNTPKELRQLKPTTDAIKQFMETRKLKDKQEKKMERKNLRNQSFNDIYNRSLSMIRSKHSFAERMVLFWGNHFTVSSAGRKVVGPIAVSYETEVIRPHIFGRFEDMLLDVVRHPAMLMYLDNHVSIGPNSRAGQKRKRGLNENLAREILELHTLGVNGGYSQKDVTEFAKVLTGWSIKGRNEKVSADDPKHGFRFKSRIHEPGQKSILGRTYMGNGLTEGLDVLTFLAHHPATANFIATKLVRHFISDNPPASAIKKIERVFIASKGDLAKVSHALIDLEDAWQEPLSKTKQPYELMISTFRAIGNNEPNRRTIIKTLKALRQFPFQAASPAGWSDLTKDWLTPEALMRRIEWARTLAVKQSRSLVPQALFANTIAPIAAPETKLWIDRAPSGVEAIALILASPEFQRR